MSDFSSTLQTASVLPLNTLSKRPMFDLHGYLPSLLEGTLLTITVALVSLLISGVLGLAGALAKLSPYRILRILGQTYTTLTRGVPDLVLMLLIFFGGQMLVNQAAEAVGYEEYIEISPFIAGTLTIGFIFGAYMTETFRGAFLSVPAGQIEAGKAYGMTSGQIFRRILFPQMMRHALPGFGNNWLVLLKTTALVSIIGLEDMLWKANLAAGALKKPFTFYLAAAIIFLIITSVSIIGLRWAEKKYNVGVRTA